MILDKKLEATKLYSIYGELLTKKQQMIFEFYYFEDYSINEISEMLLVSKNAVYGSIINTQKKLEHYEKVLAIKGRYQKNIEMLEKYDVSKLIIEKLL